MDMQRATLADQVAYRLVEHIEVNDLEPGSELPPVGELAETFGVSRLVVREAIRTLAAREILVSSQGKQARVSTPSAAVLAQIIEFRLHQRSLSMGDLFAVRRLLECETARLAAQAVADGYGDPLPAQTALDVMASGVDRETFVIRDVEFHAVIAQVAGNSLLSFMLDSLGGVLRQARAITYDARSQAHRSHDETVAEHRAVLDAIVAGDPDAAVRAMREHLESTAADVGERQVLAPTDDRLTPRGR
jgi:GntR family transcriptional repressor for pyruvate dehydrogenase complex